MEQLTHQIITKELQASFILEIKEKVRKAQYEALKAVNIDCQL
jgi:hypothetical protein